MSNYFDINNSSTQLILCLIILVLFWFFFIKEPFTSINNSCNNIIGIQDTCTNCVDNGNKNITAKCKKINGLIIDVKFNYSQCPKDNNNKYIIQNNDGMLECGNACNNITGIQATCSQCIDNNSGNITAACNKYNGNKVPAVLDYLKCVKDNNGKYIVQNNDGVLECNNGCKAITGLHETCRECVDRNAIISASCKNKNNNFMRTDLKYSPCPKDSNGKYMVVNNNGVLECDK